MTYHLQVSSTGDFADTRFLVVNVVGLTDTSFTPTSGLEDGDYNWRLRAVDGAGNDSNFSAARSFSLDATPPASPTGIKVRPFVVTGGATEYRPVFVWNQVTKDIDGKEETVVRYDVRLASHPEATQTGTAAADTTTFTFPVAVKFGDHHVFQVRPVDDFGNVGNGGLFLIDTTVDGGIQTPTFTVRSDDFLPLGGYVIAVSAVDKLAAKLDAADKPRHQSPPAILPFSVSELAISLQPSNPSVTQGTPVSLRIEIDPKGVSVDGAQISINVAAPLQFGAVISTGGGVTITQTSTSTTVDLRATFDSARTGTFTLATIQINTPSAVSPAARNVVFINTGGRKTVGLLGNASIPAVPVGATVTVAAPSAFVPPTNVAPTAVAAADPTTLNEGGTVNFDGTASTDTDGTIISYGWDFGDGNTGAGDTVSHTYADDSSFEVVLTVTDDDGATGTDTLTITVNNLDPAVEAGDNQTAKSGDTVTIAATFTDAGTLDTHTATINWGDTTTDSGTVTQGAGSGTVGGSHVYDSIGDVIVTVTVTDDDGGVGSDTLTVTVQAAVNEDPVAAAGDDQTVNEGETALFDGTTSSDPDGTITKLEWDFGDGETAEGATQTHVYADEGTGTFTVTLTVTDDLGATASDTLDVTVNNVAPEVTAGADQDAKEGDTVRISASFVEVGSEDTHTATIAWGDGTITELANVGSPLTASFVYGDDDKFTVSITITDNDGGENTDSLEVDIDNVAPIVVPGPDQSAFVNANVSIGAEFTDRGTQDTHTATIDWNDGTVEPGAVTEAGGSGSVAGAHPYGNADTFEVLVTVRDDEGEEGEATLEVVTVAAGDLPLGIAVSGLNLSTNVVIAGQPVTATFRIENTTDNRNTGEVRVFVRGDEEGTIAFDLLGRATKTVSLSIVKGVAGVFPVVVGDNLAEFRIEKARLEISNLSVAPRGPGPGSVVEISADARNAGGEPGTFTVSITANGSSAEGQLRLPPGASRPVVRFIPIPNVLPASGIEAEGFHTVTVDGESDFYEVKGAVVNTPVPTSYGFDPAKTSSTAADGTPLVLVPGGTSKLGSGSITLSIPVRAAVGVRVVSFVDLTSGFRIINTDVEIPIRDPDTGETLLTLIGELEEQLQGTAAADAATATFKFLDMIVDEQREDLSADDPIVGRLGVAVKARLSRLPEGLNVQEFIKKQLKDSDRVAVESVTRADGKIVANEAGTVTVKAPALGVGDVTEVEMTIKVSAKWVETYGEFDGGVVSNIRIARVDEQQNVEIIVPQCTGPDDNGEYTCVGVTQGGFSEFSLLALVDTPTEFETRNLVVSPKSVAPGEAVKITVDIVNTSTKAGSFSAILKIQRPGTTESEPIAVEGITLEGGEEGRVSFFVSRDEQGTYQVDVEGLGDSFDVFEKILAQDLRFSDLVITPAEVRPGQPVTLRMSVENLGGDGRAEIEFRINGVLTELRSISVPGGATVPVTFEFTPPARREIYGGVYRSLGAGGDPAARRVHRRRARAARRFRSF